MTIFFFLVFVFEIFFFFSFSYSYLTTTESSRCKNVLRPTDFYWRRSQCFYKCWSVIRLRFSSDGFSDLSPLIRSFTACRFIHVLLRLRILLLCINTLMLFSNKDCGKWASKWAERNVWLGMSVWTICFCFALMLLILFEKSLVYGNGVFRLTHIYSKMIASISLSHLCLYCGRSGRTVELGRAILLDIEKEAGTSQPT